MRTCPECFKKADALYVYIVDKDDPDVTPCCLDCLLKEGLEIYECVEIEVDKNGKVVMRKEKEDA